MPATLGASIRQVVWNVVVVVCCAVAEGTVATPTATATAETQVRMRRMRGPRDEWDAVMRGRRGV